jgi:hypothetical protein
MVTAGLGVLLLVTPALTIWPGPPRSGSGRDTASTSTTGATGISPAAAQALEDKMRALSTPVPPAARSLKPVTITEAEANSYLKYRGGTFLPPAVHDPELHITSDHVSGTADVDFNELNQPAGGAQGAQKTVASNDWATRALSAIFSGKQRVAATGKLDTANGQGRVTIENVTIGTVTVPPVLVDWLLENYVAKRYNIDLSKPFALPDHVTHIELAAGRALLLRSTAKGR